MDREQKDKLNEEWENVMKAIHSLWFLKRDLHGVHWKPTGGEPLPIDFEELSRLLEHRRAEIERLLEQP